MRQPTMFRDGVLVMLAAMLLGGGPATGAGENVAVRAQEASSLLLRGNTEQAIAAYSDALRDEGLPTDRRATILNDRGVAYSRLGQRKLALDDYNRAVQLFPEYAPVYNNRGTTLLALGLSQEALKDFDRAIALAPGYAAAYNNRAAAMLQLGQPGNAVRDYTRAVTLMPQSAAPLTGRGRALLDLRRPHAAMRDFARAIAADPRSGPAYRARAEAAMAVERYGDAIEDLSRAIAFDPNSAPLHVQRGHAYLLADNAGAAIRDFSRALEIEPRLARALAGRGLAHGKVGAYEEAEADLARAIEFDPRSAESFAFRAWLNAQNGQPDIGMREIEKALRIETGRADVYWAKGEVERTLGRNDEAVASFRKALSIDPGYRDAILALQQMGAYADERTETASAIEGWRVITQGGRSTALLEGHPKLRVPLEMAGEGTPRLLEWELKDAPFKGIGLLHYHAGFAEGKNGPDPVEQVAIVDLTSGQVVSLQLDRQGDRKSVWTWGEGKVTISSIDGVTDDIALRSAKPKEVAQRRPVETHTDSGIPFWAPWSQGPWGSTSNAQRGAPPRKQKSKTFFDFLFGN